MPFLNLESKFLLILCVKWFYKWHEILYLIKTIQESAGLYSLFEEIPFTFNSIHSLWLVDYNLNILVSINCFKESFELKFLFKASVKQNYFRQTKTSGLVWYGNPILRWVIKLCVLVRNETSLFHIIHIPIYRIALSLRTCSKLGVDPEAVSPCLSRVDAESEVKQVILCCVQLRQRINNHCDLSSKHVCCSSLIILVPVIQAIATLRFINQNCGDWILSALACRWFQYCG